MKQNTWRLIALNSALLLAFASGCLAEPSPGDEDFGGDDSADDENVDRAAMELGANLLKNGGFESGLNYWQKVTGMGGTVQVITGAGSYLRTKDPSTDGAAYVMQKVNVTAGKKYHLLVKTRRLSGPGVPEFGVMFDAGDADKWVAAGTSNSWHWLSFDVTAPPGATHATVAMGGFWTADASGASPAASTYDWDGAGMHQY